METIGNDSLVKISNVFECKLCNYVASRKYNLEIHNNSIKHKNIVLETNEHEKLVKVSNTRKNYECESCEKKYTNNSGLWKHKKKCIDKIGLANVKHDLANEEKQQRLVEYLLKENSEFKYMMLEMAKNTGINHSHNTNSHNTTNNAFNLNFFLNETCKDAMNICDFVSSIKVNLEELENTGRQGYIEGISSIILKRLNNLEHTFRPLHCSDSKREVFYVKDNNEWKKENEEKSILTKAIKVIANENIKQINHWREKYPDCTDADSKKNNLYLKIVSNSMNGSTAEESSKNIYKIISNVAKEVIIDKMNL
jgi:hypothetical protein